VADFTPQQALAQRLIDKFGGDFIFRRFDQDPADTDEPWKRKDRSEHRYMPLQARDGDYALFLKSAAIEISYDNARYLIVPNHAVLVLAREDIDLDDAIRPDGHP